MLVMIFDFIFIRIYRTKFPDPTYAAKVVLIVLQSLILSSIIKLFMAQMFGAGYLEELSKNGNMKMVYLLPIIPCSIFTHFLYTERRILRLVEKFRKYSNIQLNLRLVLSLCLLLALIFVNTIINKII